MRNYIAFTEKDLANSLNYTEYRYLMMKLVDNQSSSGENQSDEYINYTKLAWHRMSRIDDSIKLTDNIIDYLQALEMPMKWIVFTESWCGDAGQNIPYLSAMVDAAPNIELLLLLRDENIELMERYQTNGGNSIPKLVAVTEDLQTELFIWGPRPVRAQNIIIDWKIAAEPRPEKTEIYKDIQLWYMANKGISLQQEVLELMQNSLSV